MKIVIDEQMVWLDEQANDLLESLKSKMSTEQVEDWLMSWFESTIVPAMMGTGVDTDD